MELPVRAVQAAVMRAISAGPVVLSSPTGSGKSTEVPRWCDGPVLVIEPRRIACRALATRVAELEGSELGKDVGYVVRDERVASPQCRIVFATPGIALRERSLIASAKTLILDEFHERSLEVDLLLALVQRQRDAGLLVMSATLDGERVASHLGGVHLSAPGRAFPVDVRYRAGRSVLPDVVDLVGRVQQALRAAADDPGDVLVFLPGKAEIEACAQALRAEAFDLVPLHGGLSLDEQRRAFAATRRRKLVLATNVAETSLTLPGIGVVIDSGLVRQTHYHQGRAYLALGPIAQDSAAQRTGRAGRTAPGVCYRLWSERGRLADVTPPEVHRESLVPLVLSAAAWGERVEDLPLLDAPKAYALAAAREELAAWGALAGEAGLSACGHELFALPIDARHGRLLVEAERQGCLEDMIDLVAVLSVGRPLFGTNVDDLHPEEDLRAVGCDASAAIGALRAERAADHGASEFVVREARLARARLRRLRGLRADAPRAEPIDREALLRAVIAADPRLVHIARVRGKDLYFSNGGTELELARESAARRLRSLEAVLALDTRAFGAGRDARVLITCAMPIPLGAIARAGLGRDRVAGVQYDGKRVIATIERVYAKRVIAQREECPEGELCRAALVELLMRGSLFRKAVETTRARLSRASFESWFAQKALIPGQPISQHAVPSATPAAPAPPLEAWLLAKLESLGVESAEDIALVSERDFIAPDLPYELSQRLEREYPETVSVGDATYRAEYDLTRDQVILHMIKGSRRDAPPLAYLPKLPGLRICVAGPRGMTVVRERG